MGFLFPGFLYALGFLAIPIIIHLFNFRRYKIVFFSNTQLLRDIQQQTKAKSKLKHLLVLLARLLFFASLVLAFSQPFLPVVDSEKSKKEQLVSIYVDNSFSMEGECEQGIMLESAKNMALGICDAYDHKTRFLLITNDFDKKHQHFVSREKITEYITSIQSTPKIAKLNNVMERQLDIFKEFTSQYSNSFYIISDFQKNTGKLTECKPDSASNYYLLPLNPQKTANLYVDSCWFDNPARVLNQVEVLNLRIVNNSDEDLFKIPVNLFLNDSLKAMSPVDVPARNSAVISLNYTNTSMGMIYGRIEISDYPITYDNNFYFSYKIDKNLDILSVNGQDNKYLSTLFANDEYFILTNNSLNEINYFNLKVNNTVIFNQIDEISSGMVNEIKDFINNGGSFVLIPSDNANIESYNNLLSIFGAPVFEKADTQKLEIKNINTNALLFKNVFRKIENNIRMPVLYKYYTMHSSNRSLTEVLLSDENNKPVFSVTPYNKGKIYVFNFPLNEKASDFITHPLFVPIFYNIGFNSIGSSAIFFTLGVNNSIALSKNLGENKNNTLRIKQKNGDLTFIPGINQSTNEPLLFLYDNIKEAGHYSIYDGETEIQPLSANYNLEESDLTFYGIDELQETIEKLQYSNFLIYSGDSKNITGDIIAMEKGIPLWKYFILAAILFLAIEIAVLRLL